MPRELTVKTGLKVDANGLRQHLAIWSVALGKSAQEAVREQAGLLAQDMLNYTLPIAGQPGERRGEGLDARDVGVASMERDIDRIFKPLEKASFTDIARYNDYGVFADYIAERRKAGLQVPKYVEKYAAGSDIDGPWRAWLQFRAANQDKPGRTGNAHFEDIHGDNMDRDHIRVRGGTDVDDYSRKVSASKDVYFISNRDARVKRYVSQMKSHVGRMKAVWLEIGWKIGRKMRAPGWIAGHVGQGNYILEDASGNATKPEITIGNRIQGKMTKSPGRDLWKTAVNHRAYAMRVAILQKLQRATRGTQTSVLEMAHRLGIEMKNEE